MSRSLSPLPTVFGRSADATASLQRVVQSSHRWRLRLYRKLASGYHAGTSFAHVILRLAERAQRKRPKAALTRALRHWAERIEYEGALLPDVISGWVPPIEHMIVASTEDDQAPRRAAWFLEKRLAMASTTKASLVYPLILVAGLFLMLFILGTNVLPTIFAMRNPQGDPTAGMLVTIAQNAWLVCIPFLLLVVVIRRSLPLWTGERRSWVDHHLWPWTQWRRTEGQAFLFAFSALWGGGMTDLVALHALCEGAPPWRRERIGAIAYWVAEGHPLAEAMELAGHGFPDPDLIEDIADADGDPQDMAKQMAVMAEESAKEDEDNYRIMMMFFGIGIMGLTILAVVAIAAAVISSFDFTGTTDLLSGRMPAVQ